MKPVAAVVMVVVTAGAAWPALAAEQMFDLVCTGTESVKAGGKHRPYEVRYSIDLGAGKWCSDQTCGSIAEADPGKIVLVDDVPALGTTGTRSAWVSRQTGRLSDLYVGSFMFWEREARCVPAEFTGFAEGRF